MYHDKNYNELYLSPGELKSFILGLESRRDQIIKRIRIIGENKLTKEKCDMIKDDVSLVAKLNELEK